MVNLGHPPKGKKQSTDCLENNSSSAVDLSMHSTTEDFVCTMEDFEEDDGIIKKNRGINKEKLIIIAAAFATFILVLFILLFINSNAELSENVDTTSQEVQGNDNATADDEVSSEEPSSAVENPDEKTTHAEGVTAEESSENLFQEEVNHGDTSSENSANPATTSTVGSNENALANDVSEEIQTANSPPSGSTISIISPHNGARQAYDETIGPAIFRWEGAASRIIFSRSRTMKSINKVALLNGRTSYHFNRPYPGTWYWKVESENGSSPIYSFHINPPIRRNFPVKGLTSGGNLSGNGGTISWQADKKIARYKVLLTQNSYTKPQYRFGTTTTSVILSNVSPGKYDIRVGAFSEVSGRWEWQTIKDVTIE